jgi:hypothetical protein
MPLHGGHCPPWLFARMRVLAAAVAEVVVDTAGPAEMLARLSDPVWLQAFGSLLGFDWHSSGLTTVATGALKEGLAERSGELGLFLCGGKGSASRATPREIAEACDRHALSLDPGALQHASRMAAKVDNAAIQDGFTIYHHVFAFTADGRWAVVQQGMDEGSGMARRYHWLGDPATDFVAEPHTAVAGAPARHEVLNMVAEGSGGSRAGSVELARDGRREVLALLKGLEAGTYDAVARAYARAHPIPRSARIEKALNALYDLQPADYAAVLGVSGVGASTLRALAMAAEVAFGARPAFVDPVRYAFAHGGKDGHPFPVRREVYDRTIDVFERAIRGSRLGESERLAALRRLAAIGADRL